MSQQHESSAESAASPGDQPYDMETLCRERDEYVDKWKRAQADLANLRRRTQSDIDAAVRRSQASLLDGLLLAVDHLEMALASPATTEETANLARGVELTRDQILAALTREGVTPIQATETFDPKLHEAVGAEEREDAEPGTILAVLRRGYMWGEIVLRPAHVRVVAERPVAGGPVDTGAKDAVAHDTVVDAEADEDTERAN